MTDWLQIALSVLSFGVALLAIGYVARDRSADRVLLGALGVLWVGTVVQLVYGCYALASTDRDVHGFVFVLETVQDIAQILWFKWKGRRLFRMAPLHHHFEMMGWEEITVVIRFWLIAGIFVATGLGVFYAEWVAGV